ncbi:polyprenol monophosphomannose synthase [soil metagenome]
MASHAPARALVVIPTYNERENLEPLVEALIAAASYVRVLIVDDNSPDGTGDIADLLAERHPDTVSVLHRERKEGIGPAYLAGFAWAMWSDAPVVVSMDADFSHDPKDVPRLLAEVTRSDIALGSRYVPGGSTAGWPWYRRAISRCGGSYARLVLGVHVADLTGGFKAYRRAVIQQILSGPMRSDGYGFQIETVYRSIKRGFRVTEVPIVFHDRTKGRSKLSRRIVVEAMLVVWRLRFERN